MSDEWRGSRRGYEMIFITWFCFSFCIFGHILFALLEQKQLFFICPKDHPDNIFVAWALYSVHHSFIHSFINWYQTVTSVVISQSFCRTNSTLSCSSYLVTDTGVTITVIILITSPTSLSSSPSTTNSEQLEPWQTLRLDLQSVMNFQQQKTSITFMGSLQKQQFFSSKSNEITSKTSLKIQAVDARQSIIEWGLWEEKRLTVTQLDSARYLFNLYSRTSCMSRGGN